MENKTVLLNITREFKESINSLEVISPDAINSIFAVIAAKYNLSLPEINQNVNEYYENKIAELTLISQRTSKNIAQLDDSTQKAISAIKAKDEAKLAEVLEETQKLKDEIKQLKNSVYKDELTKAYNRKWLNDTFLEDEKFNCDGVLAIIDMNYFKDINDTYGHIAGDKALEYIVKRLSEATEHVIRYGGDEFLLIFDSPSSSPVAVKREIMSLRDKIKSKKLRYLEHEFRLTFSIGVIGFKHGEDFKIKLQNADTMMYEDKNVIKKLVKGIH